MSEGMRRGGLAVVLLLMVLAGELALAVRSDGLTIDEVVYIGAGYAHLTQGDYRLNPEQPPLAKLLGAVGLRNLEAPAGVSGEWDFGYSFVNYNSLPASTIIARARTGNVLLTLLLAFSVWAWTRSGYGASSALVALLLVVFHPSILAHGHLLTTDLPGAFTMFVASWAYRAWSKRPSLAWALLVGALVGVAVATRITGWLLLPSFLILEILQGGTKRLREGARLVLAIALLTPLVIWAAYDFRSAPAAGVLPPGRDEAPVSPLEATARLVFPEAYWEGIQFVIAHNSGGHPAYLNGTMSNTGWRSYYLIAFLVKNTPGFLLGAIFVAPALWKRRGALRDGALEAHLLVPACLMAALASFGHIQIGERYILPIYPYLIVLIASLTPGLLASRAGKAVLACVLLFHVAPCLEQVPRGYIPYFNFLAGGSDGGYRVLVDSNLDWGQDLPRLARYMREKGIAKVQLGYHGCDDPDRFGIVRDDLPGAHLFRDHPPERAFHGTVVVSPNILVGVVSFDNDPYARVRSRAPDDRAGVFLVYHLPD